MALCEAGGSSPLPHHTDALVAAEAPAWGWGSGSRGVGGHKGQPTLRAHRWPRRGTGGTRGRVGHRGVRRADLPVAAEAGREWTRDLPSHSLCNKCQLCMSIHLVVCFKMLKIRLFSFKNVTTQLQLRRRAKERAGGPFRSGLPPRTERRGGQGGQAPKTDAPAGPAAPAAPRPAPLPAAPPPGVLRNRVEPGTRHFPAAPRRGPRCWLVAAL